LKKFFSIGETSKINQIPIKTLRYYDEMDLLKPAYINPETGYRYYAPEQFYLIDIIKYGKRLELSLDEIKSMMDEMNLDGLIGMLNMQKRQAGEKIHSLITMISNINRTLEDLSYVTSYDEEKAPYIRSKPESYIAYMFKNEPNITKTDIMLKEIISDARFQPYLTYKYGFFLSVEGLKKGVIEFCGEYIALNKRPDFQSKQVMKFPYVKCACFQYPIFEENTNFQKIARYLNEIDYNKEYIAADEIFYCPEWKDCVYELCIDLD